MDVLYGPAEQSRPAPTTRAWMDSINDNHAYRCLPLNIANSHGWEILSPCAFEATWSGGKSASAISLRTLDGYAHLPQFVRRIGIRKIALEAGLKLCVGESHATDDENV